jgi:hypothetical protein
VVFTGWRAAEAWLANASKKPATMLVLKAIIAILLH